MVRISLNYQFKSQIEYLRVDLKFELTVTPINLKRQTIDLFKSQPFHFQPLPAVYLNKAFELSSSTASNKCKDCPSGAIG